MRVSSVLFVCTLLACLLAAASADVCSQYNGDCGGCVSHVNCGWCAGVGDADNNHVSTCMLGTSSGSATCPTTSGATWRYGSSLRGESIVVVDFKQSTQLASGPEGGLQASGNSAPKCGSDTCDWACNLQCGRTQSCRSSPNSQDTNGKTTGWNCTCKTAPFKWLGMALGTLIGVSIAIFCASVCCVGLIAYYCCCKQRRTHDHHHHLLGHGAHAQQTYGVGAYNPQGPTY